VTVIHRNRKDFYAEIHGQQKAMDICKNLTTSTVPWTAVACSKDRIRRKSREGSAEIKNKNFLFKKIINNIFLCENER
jgi:hypothetical protein